MAGKKSTPHNKTTITNLNDVMVNMDTTVGSMESGDYDVQESSFELFMLNLSKKEQEQIASDARISRAKSILMKKEYAQRLQDIQKMSATEEEKATALANLQAELLEKTMELGRKMEENQYKFSDKATKKKMKGEQRAVLETGKLSAKVRMAEIASQEGHGVWKNHQFKKNRELVIQAHKEQVKATQTERALERASFKEKKKYGIVQAGDLDKYSQSVSESYAEERAYHEENIDFLNEQIALLEKKREEGGLEMGENGEITQEIEALKEERKESRKAIKKSDSKRFGNELLVNTMKAGFHAMEGSLKLLADKADAAVNSAIDTVGQYKSSIEASMQGTQTSYDSVADTLKKALAVSPYVKQTEVLKKLNDAIEKGIAYNVEQRAFLATMTDKMVKTFDALDDTLLRVIRLQQADTTQARLGMEAQLLQFFNSTFSDHSYLYDGYDQVSQALIDANAQMTREMSVAFEYNVQKWLGSLASLGFGTDTIQTIAQGINYLGSGNVTALSGNVQLQNLMAMSAVRAGLPFGDLLTKGIDDSSVNKLLKEMVLYLKEIAEEDNAVVKAAYGDVFDFSQADLRAIKNIGTDDIANIFNQSMNYAAAVQETQNQLNSIQSRLSWNEMIDNVFDNFLYSAAESIVSNPVSAIMWRTLTAMEAVTGGIDIPFVNVWGFGLDPNMSVEQLLRTTMFGISAIAQVPNMISSINSGGGMDLGIWDFDEYTSRGGAFTSSVGGVQSTQSGSGAITSASSSDTKESALSSTEEDQEKQKQDSKESMKDEITLEVLYKEIFEKKTAIYTLDNPVSKKMDLLVTATNDSIKKLDNIYNEIASIKADTLDVRVTNMPDINRLVNNNSSVKLDSETINNLAQKIADGVIGDYSPNAYGDHKYNLSDLVVLLKYGTISVTDKTVAGQLNSLNQNLI